MKLYRLEGRTPVSVDDAFEWARWFEDTDTRVASTRVGNVRVSTVFLGVDPVGADPPRIFETMILGGPHSCEGRRTATWDEALAAHAELVARASCAHE